MPSDVFNSFLRGRVQLGPYIIPNLPSAHLHYILFSVLYQLEIKMKSLILLTVVGYFLSCGTALYLKKGNFHFI